MKKYNFLAIFFILLCQFIFGQTPESTGTGFFISGNGVIVTCAHVITDNTRITVKVNNKDYPAQVLGKNTTTDLAVLKINLSNTHHFKIANFNSVNLGDKVFVLGFPLSNFLGSDIRLTDGIVSAKSGLDSDQTYFQISAPVQPGNSGGPIINENFEVIGVAAARINDMLALLSSGAIPQNINFGVKSNYINPLLNNTRPGNGNVKSMNDAIKATVQILCYESNADNSSSNLPSVRITNNTGFTIYFLYISSTDTDEWEEDVLGEDVLLNGKSVSVRLPTPLSTRNRYDIMAEDSDGDTYTKWNVLITPNTNIEFTLRDLD